MMLTIFAFCITGFIFAVFLWFIGNALEKHQHAKWDREYTEGIREIREYYDAIWLAKEAAGEAVLGPDKRPIK